VLRKLRSEVGFGCPVHMCGNPYLYWHHFDPPWQSRQHHNPEGMIALCGEHHAKADAGAYTNDQLRSFKRAGTEQTAEVKGRFEWMRHHLLAVVGGNFFYETPTILMYKDEPSIWLNRNEDGYLMLNVRMLTTSGEPRMRLEDNFWLTKGNPEDLESPPSGKRLHVKYPNGDMLKVQFFELESVAAANKRYAEAEPERWGLSYPITAVEVHVAVGGTNVAFGPSQTNLGGITMKNCFVSHCQAGISIG